MTDIFADKLTAARSRIAASLLPKISSAVAASSASKLTATPMGNNLKEHIANGGQASNDMINYFNDKTIADGINRQNTSDAQQSDYFGVSTANLTSSNVFMAAAANAANLAGGAVGTLAQWGNTLAGDQFTAQAVAMEAGTPAHVVDAYNALNRTREQKNQLAEQHRVVSEQIRNKQGDPIQLGAKLLAIETAYKGIQVDPNVMNTLSVKKGDTTYLEHLDASQELRHKGARVTAGSGEGILPAMKSSDFSNPYYKKPLEQANKGDQFITDTNALADQQLAEGTLTGTLRGIGNKALATGKSIGNVLAEGVNHPMGVLQYTAESAPYFALPGIGTLAIGNQTAVEGRSKFENRTGQALPTTGQNIAMLATDALYMGLNYVGDSAVNSAIRGATAGSVRSSNQILLDAVRGVGSTGLRAAGKEGFAEGAQTYLEESGQNLGTYFNPDTVGQAAAIGAMSSGVVLAPSSVRNGIKEVKVNTFLNSPAGQAALAEVEKQKVLDAIPLAELQNPTSASHNPVEAINRMTTGVTEATKDTVIADVSALVNSLQDVVTERETNLANAELRVAEANKNIPIIDQLIASGNTDPALVDARKTYTDYLEGDGSPQRIKEQQDAVESATSELINAHEHAKIKLKAVRDAFGIANPNTAAPSVPSVNPSTGGTVYPYPSKDAGVRAALESSNVTKNYTPEQREVLRVFSEAVVLIHSTKELKDVSIDIKQGGNTGGQKYRGLDQYMARVIEAINNGNVRSQQYYFRSLAKFSQSHTSKAQKFQEALDAYTPGMVKIVQKNDDTNLWEIMDTVTEDVFNAGNFKKDLRKTGGFGIHNNSAELVAKVQIEADGIAKVLEAIDVMVNGSQSVVPTPVVAPTPPVVTEPSDTTPVDATPAPEAPAFPTWDTMTKGQEVTLYRGESSDNTKNGQWWTTNKAKAEKYGKVTEITLPAEVIGKHAAQGQGGTDEFYFANKKPSELVTPSQDTSEAPKKTETPTVNTKGIESLLANGNSIEGIAKKMGVSTDEVQAIKDAMNLEVKDSTTEPKKEAVKAPVQAEEPAVKVEPSKDTTTVIEKAKPLKEPVHNVELDSDINRNTKGYVPIKIPNVFGEYGIYYAKPVSIEGSGDFKFYVHKYPDGTYRIVEFATGVTVTNSRAEGSIKSAVAQLTQDIVDNGLKSFEALYTTRNILNTLEPSKDTTTTPEPVKQAPVESTEVVVVPETVVPVTPPDSETGDVEIQEDVSSFPEVAEPKENTTPAGGLSILAGTGSVKDRMKAEQAIAANNSKGIGSVVPIDTTKADEKTVKAWFAEASEIANKVITTGIQRANLVVASFYQKAKAPSKLVQVKDFAKTVLAMSPTEQAQMLSDALGETATDSQVQFLENFLMFDKSLRGTMDVMAVPTGKNNFRFKDYLQYLFTDVKTFKQPINPNGTVMRDVVTGTLDENIKTAISVGIHTFLIEKTSQFSLDHEGVAELLGFSNTKSVPYEVHRMFKNVGNVQPNVVKYLGTKAYQALQLSMDPNVPVQRKESLINALGSLAVQTMLAEGLLQYTRIPNDIIKDAKAAIEGGVNTAKRNESIYTVYLRPAYDTKQVTKNGWVYESEPKPIARIEALKMSAKGNTKVMSKLFSVEGRDILPMLKKPTKFTQPTLSNTGNEVPDATADLVLEMMQKAYNVNGYTYSAMKTLFETDPDALYAMVGVVSDEDVAKQHISIRGATESKNEALKRSVINGLDFIDSLTTDENNQFPDFYLPMSVWSVNRVGVTSNLFNEQGDKVHRALTTMTAHKQQVTISPVVDEDNKLTQYGRFLTGVAAYMEGVKINGKTVDKTDGVSFLPGFQAYISSERFQEVLDSVGTLVLGTATAEDIERVQIEVLKLEGGAMSLTSLIALYEASQAKEVEVEIDGVKTKVTQFTTSMSTGSDGVTNGMALSLLMYDAARPLDVEAMPTGERDAFNAGGIFFEGDSVDSMVKFRKSGKSDLYEQLAKVQKELLQEFTAKNPGLLSFISAMNNIDPTFGTRAGAKVSLVPFVYGSGFRSIGAAQSRAFMEQFYKALTKAMLSGDAAKIKQFQANYVALSQGARIPVAHDFTKMSIKDALDTELSLRDVKAITGVENKIRKSITKDALSQVAGTLIQARSRVSGLANVGFESYNRIYTALQEMAHTKLKAANALPYRYASSGKVAGETVAVEGMNVSQNQAIDDELKDFTPQIISVGGVHSINSKESAHSMWTETEIKDTSSTGEVSSEFGDIAEGVATPNNMVKNKDSKSITTSLHTRSVESRGAATNAAVVQAMDAWITAKVSAAMDTFNHHDENVSSIDKAAEMGQLQNKTLFNAVLDYDVYLEVLHGSLLRPLRGIIKLSKRDDTLAIAKGEVGKVMADLRQYMDTNFGGFNEDMGMLASLVHEMYALEIAKLTKYKNLKSISQYGIEGGEYTVTKKDVARINDLIASHVASRTALLKEVAKISADLKAIGAKPKAKPEVKSEIKEEPSKVEPSKEVSVPAVYSKDGDGSFQGFVGGFSDTGKGTITGDGKDVAMRKEATSFIGEVSNIKGSSSTYTSASTIAKYTEDRVANAKEDTGKDSPTIYTAGDTTPRSGSITMLARNGSLKGKPLHADTKQVIHEAMLAGERFIVGDMPGVDSQFVEFLNEIGANFKIYHTGKAARIQGKDINPNQMGMFAQSETKEETPKSESSVETPTPTQTNNTEPVEDKDIFWEVEFENGVGKELWFHSRDPRGRSGLFNTKEQAIADWKAKGKSTKETPKGKPASVDSFIVRNEEGVVNTLATLNSMPINDSTLVGKVIKQVVEALKGKLPANLKVHMLAGNVLPTALDNADVIDSLSNGAPGITYSTGNTHTIGLVEGKANKITFIHELIHASTVSALQGTSAEARKLKVNISKLRSEALSAYRKYTASLAPVSKIEAERRDKVFMDAFNSEGDKDAEFVAMAMSEPAIIDFLATVPAPKISAIDTGLISIFSAFIKSVSEFLGLTKNTNGKDVESVLSAMVNQTAQLMNINDQSSASDQVNNYPGQQAAVDAVRLIREYPSKEIFNVLPASLDVGFDTYLSSLMDTIVDKTFNHLSFPSTTYTPLQVWENAITDGRTPYTTRAVAAGFILSERELFAIETLEVALKGAMDAGITTPVYKEMERAYESARKTLKDESFYDGDWSTALESDRQIARNKRKHLFKLEGGQATRSDYMSRFMAMALASSEVNSLLGFPTLTEARVDGTLSSKVLAYYEYAMDWVSGHLTGTMRYQTINIKLPTLAQKLVDIDHKKRDQALSSVYDSVADNLDKANKYIKESGGALADKLENMIGDSKKGLPSAARTASRVVLRGAAMDMLKVSKIWRDMSAPNTVLGWKGELLNELSDPSSVGQAVRSLLRIHTRLQTERKTHKSTTKESILSNFLNGGKNLSKDDHSAITYGVLRGDLKALYDLHGIRGIEKLLSNADEVESEVARLEGLITNETHVVRSKDLAHYMTSGEVNLMLAKNALSIARDVGLPTVLEEDMVSEEAVSNIDMLVSLYAIQYMKSSHLQTLQKLFKQEGERTDGNGLAALMKYHQAIEQEAKDTLFEGNSVSIIKGYTPEITNPHREIKIVTLATDAKHLEAMGYQLHSILSADPNDVNQAKRMMYFTEEPSTQRFVTGAMSLTADSSKGTSIIDGSSLSVKDKISALKSITTRSATKLSSKSAKDYDPTNIKNRGIAPTYSNLGSIQDFRYEMTHATRDGLLQRNNNFAEIMGTYAGSNFDKASTPKHNETVIDALYKDYKENYLKDPRAYVQIGKDSTDPRAVEMYAMLPYKTRKYIDKVWGKREPMWVRNDALLATFGTNKYSIGEAFDKNPDARNVVEKTIVDMFKVLFGDTAKLRALQGERLNQELISWFKSTIVIRNLTTLMGNQSANVGVLLVMGVSPVDIIKDSITAFKAGNRFRKDNTELVRVENNMKANVGNFEDNVQLQARLKDSIARNPLKEFLDAGMLNTIVEDVSLDVEDYNYKSKLAQQLDDQLDKLNPTVRKIGANLVVAPSTELYQVLANATQLSDFTAKYTLYKHLTSKAKDKLSHEDALAMADRMFINYDVPTSKELQYANDMGFIMFTKYTLRIQRAIAYLLKERKASLLAQGMLGTALGMPLATAPAFFNVIGNPLLPGALMVPGALTQPLPIKVLSGGF